MTKGERVQIRAYVVGFGDCLLVRIPDGPAVRHMLVDFGKAPGKGGTTSMFPDIARDIAEFCGGHLDVLVVTHEHLDHMEGFFHQRAIFDAMQIDHVWMGLPSHPNYYLDYPDAQLHKRLRALPSEFLTAAAQQGLTLAPSFLALLENNVANPERVEYLRKLKGAKLHYLARGQHGKNFGPFRNVAVDILAPEPDVSVYYGRTARTHALLAGARLGVFAAEEAALNGAAGPPDFWSFPDQPQVPGPPNLSATDWRRLRDALRTGGVQTARFIDRAQNNTSLCFMLTVGGKRLLFPGDAELESWDMIAKKCRAKLSPVDFLKVAHHGSRNGTPFDGLLDVILPKARRQVAVVLLSTRHDVYGVQNPVPHSDVLEELRGRCQQIYTTDIAGKKWIDLEI